MNYLGDFVYQQTVHFKWNTNAAAGASITRATNGTLYVYQDDATATEVTTGITDTEDHDSNTGVHHCKIVTTDGFYTSGHDYFVVLKAATIDGQTVNNCVAHFSIQNRYMRGTDSAALAASFAFSGTDVKATLDGETVTVGTNNDKTGYTASTVSDKTGYSLAADQSAVTIGTCTTNTDMRGTNSAALASVCTEGRLAELDAANLPADIAAIPTTPMRGTDNAALASVCTETRLAELDAANLPADIAAIPTTPMRGTDDAALASVCTEGRLAELDAANLPTDIAAIPTTPMRGTDNAALASVCTETRLAELDAANLPADIAAIPTTPMRGTDDAALATVCTEGRLAELDAANLPTDIAAIPTTPMRGTDNAALATDLATTDGKVDSIKAKTDYLPDGFIKNTAFPNFMFTMVDATDGFTLETGVAVTAEISQDGAAFGALTNAAAEIGTTGVYKIDLEAADMNIDSGCFRFSGAGCRTKHIFFNTNT